MDPRYVRVGYQEAVELKKQVLTGEMSLLGIVKNIRTYKLLRKKELQLKQELKSELAALRSTLNNAIESLPEYIPENHEKKIISPIGVRESKDIQKELEDIKRKLERLGDSR